VSLTVQLVLLVEPESHIAFCMSAAGQPKDDSAFKLIRLLRCGATSLHLSALAHCCFLAGAYEIQKPESDGPQEVHRNPRVRVLDSFRILE
jgi:hypothetical protein